MSKEKTLQSIFTDACNHVDKIVGRYVWNYQPVVSRHEDGRDGYLVSLFAWCRSPGCKHRIEATISSTSDMWAKQLINAFITRAEYHAKSAHRIQTGFSKIPGGKIQHTKSGGKGS